MFKHLTKVHHGNNVIVFCVQQESLHFFVH